MRYSEINLFILVVSLAMARRSQKSAMGGAIVEVWCFAPAARGYRRSGGCANAWRFSNCFFKNKVILGLYWSN